MLGDLVTTEGIPLLWPLSKKKIAIPLCGNTGGMRENLVAGAAGLLTTYVFATVVLIPVLFPTFTALPLLFPAG
jgi:membrane-bound metal-dependent hydrolase YbcI (DUF457 family)